MPSVYDKSLGVRNQAISKLYQHFRERGLPYGLQDALSTLSPSCSPSFRRLRQGPKTRYGWVASHFPTGTLTPQETPSFAQRDSVKPQRHIKVKGDANPFDPDWEAYFQDRDRALALRASSAFRAKLLKQQDGLCQVCWQVIQCDEDIELHHRDSHHQNNRPANLVLLHPNCHRQVHYAPERTRESSRPARGVGHA